MKSKRFRMISLVLVLVLALQFTLVASAEDNTNGMVSWRDAQGYIKNAVVANTGFTNREVAVTQTAVTHEGYGYTTYFYAGEYNVYYHVDFNFPSAYDTYLYQAAAGVGMQETFSDLVQLSTNGLCVPDYETFGTYCATTTIHGNTGQYRVETVRELGNVPEASGTIPFAPYDCSRVMSGYEAF